MLPQKFQDNTVRMLGKEEAEALFAALDTTPPVAIRLNPYKCNRPEGGTPIGWSRYGLYLDERPSFTLDPDFHAGCYYVQEASSQFVGHILSSEDMEGARLLDMCAAPGGKSTLYSTIVGVEGLVVANEVNRQRAQTLGDNVIKWGIGNTIVTSNKPEHIAAFENWFDTVAVDAPCSGEGMFRKIPEARQEWCNTSVEQCADLQLEILLDAWQSLRGGGVLIYSTCTFNSTENEEVLQRFLDTQSEYVEPYQDVDLDPQWGIAESRVGAFQCFRFFPHRTKGEGFFAAVVRKRSDNAGRTRHPKPRRSIFSPVGREALGEVSRWVNQPHYMRFAAVGDTVYGYYEVQFEATKTLCESLSVIHSGVEMGQIFKGKLKPAHSLAMFHDLNIDALPFVELPLDEALTYLRKQDLPVDTFSEGMNLVCYNSHALGFVKRIGNRYNNLYPNVMKIANL